MADGCAVRRLAPLVAIIGPDGAGKTSTAQYLCSVIPNSQYAYLGLGSGALGLRIRGWPVLGPVLERYLGAKAKRARTPGERIPGPFTAAVIYGFARLRMRRFMAMLALRESGSLVICDRYPQAQIPGLNDGPGLSAARASGWLTPWLARCERELYTEMAQIPPTLVIRLNVDARTAWLRKPDHDLVLIERKVAAAAALTFAGARVVEVDARQPLATVRSICRQLIERVMDQPPSFPLPLEPQVNRVD